MPKERALAGHDSTSTESIGRKDTAVRLVSMLNSVPRKAPGERTDPWTASPDLGTIPYSFPTARSIRFHIGGGNQVAGTEDSHSEAGLSPAISLSHLMLALQLRVAEIVFPAIGEGAFLIARAARQRGVENDGRDD